MNYRDMILALMDAAECDTVSADAVEAWMRLRHPTLDALSRDEFVLECEDAMVQACMHGDEFNARLVESMGR